MIQHSHALTGYYDAQLVGLSVVTAVFASYTALDVAGRVTAARGITRAIWLVCGAFAMGLGIWSMHYIGMLAFKLSMPVFYDGPLVVASLAAAVFASSVALWVVSRQEMGVVRALPGSVVMGAGVAAMHYTGMAAVRTAASVTYDWSLVALSIAIAIAVAFVALRLAFHFRGDARAGWPKFASAVLMGASIPAMHYVGMAAASFTPTGIPFTQPANSVDIGALGISAVVVSTFVVLALTIVTSRIDALVAAHTAALRTSEAGRRAQELFLREVIDAHPHMVFAKDLSGRYTLANRAVSSVFGRQPSEVVGKTDAELAAGDPEQVARFVEQDRLVIETGEPMPHTEEPVYDNSTGEMRWFQTIKVPLRAPDGGGMQVLGVATDVTHRRKLEEQLRHALKMEAVGRLAGGVAHDFNNLLTAILGNAECVLDDLEEQPDQAHVAEMREIVDAGRRAAGLTRQLLAFSRKQVLQPKVIDLNALVANLHRLLSRLIGEDVELQTIAGSHLWTVEADPGQLEQVVVNIVVNARDAMPRGGTLRIRTSNVLRDQLAPRERGLMKSSEYVMLSVTDSGIGMSDEILTHVFEPFFTTKPDGRGTGLGLATVYGIVKQSGGHIWVDSAPNQGATFRIYLPRVLAAPSEEPVAPIASELPPGHGTILVVEDDDAVRRVTSMVLTGRGYRVIEASGGDEAIAAAHHHAGSIDLLVTDVVMPRMSGREVAAHLCRVRPDLKVLYVSGYTDDAILRHGVVKEGVSMLQKPFTPIGLAQRVHDILNAPPFEVEALRVAG